MLIVQTEWQLFEMQHVLGAQGAVFFSWFINFEPNLRTWKRIDVFWVDVREYFGMFGGG
jgi:hypothetical protein